MHLPLTPVGKVVSSDMEIHTAGRTQDVLLDKIFIGLPGDFLNHLAQKHIAKVRISLRGAGDIAEPACKDYLCKLLVVRRGVQVVHPHYRAGGEHRVAASHSETGLVAQQVLDRYLIVVPVADDAVVLGQYAARAENRVPQRYDPSVLQDHYAGGGYELGNGGYAQQVIGFHLLLGFLVRPAIALGI